MQSNQEHISQVYSGDGGGVQSKGGKRRVKKRRGRLNTDESRTNKRIRMAIRVVLLVGVLGYIAYQFYDAVMYDWANSKVEPKVINE